MTTDTGLRLGVVMALACGVGAWTGLWVELPLWCTVPLYGLFVVPVVLLWAMLLADAVLRLERTEPDGDQ